MKHVPIPIVEERPAHARLKELFRYDPETGAVTRRVQVRGSSKPSGASVGTTLRADGRGTVTVDGRRCYVYQVAWALATGVWPDRVDHRDGDPSNNRFGNLRQATPRMNSENQRRAKTNSKTGILGVSPCSHDAAKFVAHITVRGVRKNLGVFASAVEAHGAYLLEKRASHEGCTI